MTDPLTTAQMRKVARAIDWNPMVSVDHQAVYLRTTIEAAADQIEALKAELDEEKQRSDGYGSACAESEAKLAASQARVEAQAAEIGRLREALTQIAAWGDDAPATTKVAKQALAGAGGAHGS